MIAYVKFPLLVLWILVWYPPVWLAHKCKKLEARDRMVRLCYKGVLRIIGIRLQLQGEPAAIRPLLVVSNHLSYLDIPILCSQVPVRFMPKSEIAKWPVIGSICRACDAIFVDRRPEKIQEVKEKVHAALIDKAAVCLFPEGTTGNGLHVLNFKSGFFQLAEEGFAVQPVAITYTHIRRLPITVSQWPAIAWYGDMDLAPHLWQLLGLGSITALVTFLPCVTIAEYGDRKALAAHCQQVISESIESTRHR